MVRSSRPWFTDGRGSNPPGVPHGARTPAPLYRALRHVGKQHRQKYVQYQPWLLLALFLWAALHDRPVSWACQRRHWSTTALKPWRLPSRSTVTRRVDQVGCGLVWAALERHLRDTGQLALLAFLDGKALPIGGCGHDPDARLRARGQGDRERLQAARRVVGPAAAGGMGGDAAERQREGRRPGSGN